MTDDEHVEGEARPAATQMDGPSELETRRWEALCDAEAWGYEISEDERRWLSESAAVNPVWAAELRAVADLRALGSEEPTEDDRKLAARAVQSQSRRRRLRRWRTGLALGLGAAAAAAGLVIVFSLPAETASSRVLFMVGNTHLQAPSGGPRTAGERIGVPSVADWRAPLTEGMRLQTEDGAACFAVSAEVRACIGARTRLVLAQLERSRQTVRLERGRIAVEVNPACEDCRFVVDFGSGRAAVRGTRFGVTIVNAKVSRVDLVRGSLEVTTPQSERLLRRPASVLVPRPPPAPIQPLPWNEADVDWIDGLLRPTDLLKDSLEDGAAGFIEISAKPDAARTRIDGVPLGQSPVRVRLGTGSHQFELDASGYESQELKITVAEGQRVHQAVRLEAVRARPPEQEAPPPSSSEAGTTEDTLPPPAPSPTAAELLTRARQLRSRGQDHEALGTYQRLLTRYPRSAETHVAQVSMGQLLLSMGRPAEALDRFQAYGTRGALGAEALYGTITAHRQLGQIAREEQAIRRFLELFPRSMQAAHLRERLDDLDGGP